MIKKNRIFKILLKKLEKINNFNIKLSYYVSVFLIFSIVFLMLTQVILRRFGSSISYSEELARWFLIFVCFISSFSALVKGVHIGITILVKRLPKPIRKIIIIFNNIIVIIFFIYVFWYGLIVAIKAWDQSGGIILIPMFYAKMGIPLGAFMMIIYLFYNTLIFLMDYRNNEPDNFLLSRIEEEELE